jgi:iron complex transport system substrate-binding protein
MRVRSAVAATIPLLTLLSCGGDDEALDATPSTTVDDTRDTASSTTVDEVPDGVYPVTIAHKFGATEIASQPERIVVVGLTEQDPLLSLGVIPVATTEWFGGHPGAVWPWAQDELQALGTEPPVVLDATDGEDFEAIAKLQPDLILGLYSGITPQSYDTLSAIAPTVAQPGDYGDWGIPWDEELLTVGDIVGKPAEAEALVAEVQALFEQAKADHPEFVRASAAMATPYEGIFVYAPGDPRGRLLSALGFEMPAELAELATDEFGFQLSLERVDLLDVDALVWLDTDDAETEQFAGPAYDSLRVRTEGREVLLDSESQDALGGATSFVTALSLPYLLDGIIPMLAAAVDGDPATTAASAGG